MGYKQQAGHSYDNEVANAIHENTPDSVTAHSARGSGNTLHPSGDVLVRTPTTDHWLELKRHSWDRGKRGEILNESNKGEISQLLECRNKYTDVWLGVKFTHCRLLLLQARWSKRLRDDGSAFTHDAGDMVIRAFSPGVTNAGNLRMQKPDDTDVWPSATAGAEDHEVCIQRLQLDTHKRN